MTDKDEAERAKVFAELLSLAQNPPDENSTFIGHMLVEWLKAHVADPGTSIDTGGGFGAYDIWVKFENVEYSIKVQRSELQLAKDRGEYPPED